MIDSGRNKEEPWQNPTRTAANSESETKTDSAEGKTWRIRSGELAMAAAGFSVAGRGVPLIG
jgi:hypothetical protein